MTEVAGHNLREDRLESAPKRLEFIPAPDGIDLLDDGINRTLIVHGHTSDGQPSALKFDLYEDPKINPKGFLSKLPRGPFGRIAAGITMAAGAVVGAGAALSACAPNADQANQPTYGTHQGALTMDQILGVGQGQQIPWSQWGDLTSNFGEMNGKKYIFVDRNDSLVYVECQAIQDCLTANAGQVKVVQGLEAAGLFGPYSGSGIFQDQTGKNKLIVDPFNVWAQMCDVAENGNGTLEASNCAEIDPPMSVGPSIFNKDGVPHALWPTGSKVKDRNLHTNATVDTGASGDWGMSCGVGFEAGNIVVASQKQVIQGVTHCRLVTATSWADLVDQLVPLDSLKNGSTDLGQPRIADGNILIYARYDANASKLWYALIPDPPQNPESDADVGSPDADTAQPDAVGSPDADVAQPDAEVAQPDTEIAQDTADAADAVVEQDVGPDTPATDAELPPDNGPEGDASPDTPPDQDTSPTPDTPDVQQPDTSDTPKPDTTPDPCNFAKSKLTIPPGCQLENCANPFVDITGKCTFSVDIGKAKPVTVELDGAYQIDLLEKIGTHLAGKYKLVDNGNQFNTAAGNLLIGVEGTTYSGKFMDGNDYLISCQEGRIIIFLKKLNGQLELLATLDGGEDNTFDLSNPQPLTEPDTEQQPEPQPESQSELQPEPAPDASQPEAANDIGSPKPEPASDTGPSQPEPNSTETKDTTPASKPSKPPSNDGGCNITGNLNATAENLNSTGHLATIALALMALGFQIRRRPF